MKFLLRTILVLAVAVGLGVCLYYAVQALPDDLPDPRQTGISAGTDDASPGNQAFQPAPNRRESSEREVFRGFRPWTLTKVAGRILMFAVVTAITVVTHKLVGAKGKPKKVPQNPPRSH